jgi:hypothetical protein
VDEGMEAVDTTDIIIITTSIGRLLMLTVDWQKVLAGVLPVVMGLKLVG